MASVIIAVRSDGSCKSYAKRKPFFSGSASAMRRFVGGSFSFAALTSLSKILLPELSLLFASARSTEITEMQECYIPLKKNVVKNGNTIKRTVWSNSALICG